MKAIGFRCDYPGLAGAWARVGQALRFNPLRRDLRQGKTRSASVFDRLDHWFWQQAQRDREAYLAGARDIYDLEQRIRRLERSGRGGFVA